MTRFATVIFFGLFCFGDCKGNPLDDCTLQNMAGVTSDAAAQFIRRACLGKVSVTIPRNDLMLQGTAKQGDNILIVNLENKSRYAITELIVRISTDKGDRWSDYEVSNFFYTTAIVSKLPPDPASYLQIGPYSSVTFAIPNHKQVARDNWNWEIISVKGYTAADLVDRAQTSQIPSMSETFDEEYDVVVNGVVRLTEPSPTPTSSTPGK